MNLLTKLSSNLWKIKIKCQKCLVCGFRTGEKMGEKIGMKKIQRKMQENKNQSGLNFKTTNRFYQASREKFCICFDADFFEKMRNLVSKK